MRIDVWLPEETLVKAIRLPPDSRIISVEVIPAENPDQHGSRRSS